MKFISWVILGVLILLVSACNYPEDNTPIPPQCSDVIDNDGDSLIDLFNRQCRDANNNDESTP